MKGSLGLGFNETSTKSVCIFCAAAEGIPIRRPTHLRQRYLHRTSAAAKPPDAKTSFWTSPTYGELPNQPAEPSRPASWGESSAPVRPRPGIKVADFQELLRQSPRAAAWRSRENNRESESLISRDIPEPKPRFTVSRRLSGPRWQSENAASNSTFPSRWNDSNSTSGPPRRRDSPLELNRDPQRIERAPAVPGWTPPPSQFPVSNSGGWGAFGRRRFDKEGAEEQDDEAKPAKETATATAEDRSTDIDSNWGHLRRRVPAEGVAGENNRSSDWRSRRHQEARMEGKSVEFISFRKGLAAGDDLQEYARPTNSGDLESILKSDMASQARFDHKLVEETKTHVREKPRKRPQSRRQNDDDDVDEEYLDDEVMERAELRRKRKLERAARKKAGPPTPITIPEFITVGKLARALKVKIDDFLKKLVQLGFGSLNHDHVLNAENAGLVAMEYHHEPTVEKIDLQDLKAMPEVRDKSTLPPRPPVVTIMGHVDHGKTTLLDFLRKSSIVATEHGGITQHIGAFSVSMPSGKLITFLDTPGHEAFLSMRQRGANVTDIVILVVAADDSVKPQTVEAIKHAQAAKVPIVVAINKVDKPEADVERVKQDLTRHGVVVEDFGGDTQAVCVSGKTGQGMSDLEEVVATLSEVLDLRAATDGQAEGWVLEGSTKKAGRVATVLVRRGTLRTGTIIVAGSTWAKIRKLRNEAGADVVSAGPGTPVEVDGWRDQPNAGDEVLEAPDEAKAKSVVALRLERAEKAKMSADVEAVNDLRRAEHERREQEKRDGEAAVAGDANDAAASASNEANREPSKQMTTVSFIIKADTSGSAEAVRDSIVGIGNDQVRSQVLRTGVGPVSEFDVEHAAAARGHVLAFNVDVVDPAVARMAEPLAVSIMRHNIIYRLTEDVRAKLSEQLPPLLTQRVTGEADIAQLFSINVKGRHQKPVAGCKVRNGTIARNAKVRVLRDKKVVYDGTLASLKNVKKDVMEMRKGNECGMAFQDWDDFRVGDQVQCYEVQEEKRHL